VTARAVLARLALAVLLAAATLFLYLGVGRFALTGPELLPSPPGAAAPDGSEIQHGGWRIRGDVGVQGAGHVHLRNGEPSGQASLFRLLPVPAGASHLALSAEIHLRDVVGGRDLWHRARIILPSRPAGGDVTSWRYDLPHTLVRRQGSADWTRVEEVFEIPPGSEVLVSLQLLHATGSFQVRDLSLRAAVEKPWFPPLQIALVLLWLAAAAWILWPVLRPILAALGQGRPSRQHLRVVAALAVALALVGGALLPADAKQQLRDLVPDIRFGSATSDLSRGEPPAAAEYRVEDGQHPEPVTGPSQPVLAPSDSLTPDFLAPHRLRWLIVDKGGHVAGFALLAFLACWAAAGSGGLAAWDRVALISALVGLAALTEVWQVMAMDRGASRDDVAINLVGLALGAMLWAVPVLGLRFLSRRRGGSASPRV